MRAEADDSSRGGAARSVCCAPLKSWSPYTRSMDSPIFLCFPYTHTPSSAAEDPRRSGPAGLRCIPPSCHQGTAVQPQRKLSKKLFTCLFFSFQKLDFPTDTFTGYGLDRRAWFSWSGSAATSTIAGMRWWKTAPKESPRGGVVGCDVI